jgi:hypothetical protein
MRIFEDIASWYTGLQVHILRAPHLEPLRALYPVRPEELRDFYLGQRLHEQALHVIELGFNVGAMDLVVQAVDEFVRHYLKVQPTGLCDGADVGAVASALTGEGYARLPAIPPAKVQAMKAYFEDQPVIAGNDLADEERCSRDEARKAGNLARLPTKAVLACPHLVEIANSPLVLSAVTRALGAIPTIVGYTAWWSFADATEARDAQLFHFDAADYRFCKLFMYLTDVDETSGPHVFVPRSQDAMTVKAARGRWTGGVDEFDKWYFETLRKTDEDTLRVFGTPPVDLTGEAGSTLLVNTRGIHKGKLPETSDRLLAQVLYSVTPRVQEEFEPLAAGAPGTEHVPARVMTVPPFDYANRLFVS